MTLVGRSDPHGDADDLGLKSGRWAAKPGEVVVSASFAGPDIKPGFTMKTSEAVDSPPLTVVGLAVSASKTADVWATPGQVSALASEGSPVTSQMLYRFDSAGTKEQITADRKKLAAVPTEALLGTESWLDTKRAADQGAAAKCGAARLS